MHRDRPICKAYYAVDVKRITPPNWARSVDKPPICPIMRISIWAEIFLSEPGYGGYDAYQDVERCQKCQPACTRRPEPPPRKNQRCPVSSTPFLRPARSSTGQIRNAAKGNDRPRSGWSNSNSLRVLPSEIVSAPQTLRDGRAGRVAASTQRAAAGSQIIRRCADLCDGHVESRTGTAHRELATVRGQGVWHQGTSPQYRKSAGTAPKKGVPNNSVSDAPNPENDQGMEGCKRQYETLRRHALDADEISSSIALEMAFIEYRGMAAWLTYVPPCLSPSAGSDNLKTAEIESGERDLIVVLADLVLGDRLEEKDDPRC